MNKLSIILKQNLKNFTNMKKRLYILLIFFIITSCAKNKNNHDIGFYFWRSQLQLNAEEQQLLSESKSPFLYTRFFDIVKQNDAFIATAVLKINPDFKSDKKIVPVIFITNETWLNITEPQIEFLANKIANQLLETEKQNPIKLANEIQIDSDWTVSTKDDYFRFLSALKKASGKEITCTLRLHQVKDKKLTGIPPVDKLYLMCYATSSPLENTDVNSILDVKLLKSYLKNIDDYPKKLDIALPIYSWGIVSNHLGKKKLINAVSVVDLKNNANFKKLNDTTYEVLKDDFYFGVYLSKGFTIKVEEINPLSLKESLDFIEAKLNYPYQIIYYHLDSRFTKNYPDLLTTK